MRSRLIRLFSWGKGLRLLLQLTAVLLLVFWLLVGAAAATFHWLIVPRAPLWRDDVAQVLSRTLAAPVTLEGLRAFSDEGVPTIEFSGLRIRDARGESALLVQHGRASLSARSLLNLGFDSLQLRGLALRVERDAGGQWRVGGVALTPGAQAQPTWFMNWLFQQSHARLDEAELRWRDDWWAAQQGLRRTPTLTLTGVRAVLRNDGRRHRWRVDATPSVAPEQVWTLRADLKSPSLSRAVGDWRQWSGQVFAHAAGVDLNLLTQHLDARTLLGVQSASGRGDWRAWVDVQRGQVQGVTNDWALTDVSTRLRKDLQPLALQHLGGRLTLYRPQGGWRVETQGLQFETADGLRWPGGDLQWRWQAGDDSRPEENQFTATDMDLGAMTAVALRLPLPESIAQPWRAWRPQGRVDSVQLSWQGPIDAPQHFQAKGSLRELSVQAGELPRDAQPGVLARPGVRGLNLRFEANERGGKASAQMTGGWWWLPGVWDDPEVAVTHLQSELSWAPVKGAWQVRARQLAFRNPDLEANGEVTWTEGPGSGLLDLRLQASRANLGRLGRYLPRVTAASARRYVTQAVQAGTGREVHVRVQGAVDEVPFARPGSGVFQISGRIEGARLDVAPKALSGKTWLRLKDLNARYTQDGVSLRLDDVQARWDGQEAVRITQGEAVITDLMGSPQLSVKAQASGPLQTWLTGVESSALRAMTGGALEGVRATGQGALQLDLAWALLGKDDPQVRGQFDVSRANVQWAPEWPMATGVSARVDFDGQGVRVQAQAAQAVGGAARVQAKIGPQGGWQAQVQGRYTAQALRDWPMLHMAKPWLGAVSGAGDFSFNAQKAVGQAMQWDVAAGLQGVSLAWPAPLNKAAEADWQFDWKEAGGQTHVRLGPKTAPILRAQLQRDAAPWRGQVALGRTAAQAPAQPFGRGMLWSVQLRQLDVDAWQSVWDAAQQAAKATAPLTRTNATSATPAPWLPTRVQAQVGALRLGGWDFHDLQLDAMPDARDWRADVQARELAGWLRLESANAQAPQGRIVARFDRLGLSSSAVQQVESNLTGQPRELPALDIEVKQFELKGRNWDRVSLLARNEVVQRNGRRLVQWRLERLSAEMPEATLSAKGLWAPVDIDLMAAAQGLWRRTQLDVNLTIRDSGALLARFEMPGVVKAGAGVLSGQVSWQGSPLNFDKKSLGGYLTLDVGRGQFLKADPGIAKLLGVLSLQSLPRRLLLDFRDVFNEGFAFDSVKGRAQIDAGVLFTRDLAMRGPAAAVLIEGRANVIAETQDLQVLVLPQLDAGTLSLWAGLANPVVGLATYVAQKMFGNALAKANVQAMHITGSWADPKVENVDTGAVQNPAPVRSVAAPAPLTPTPTPVPPAAATPVVPPLGDPAMPALKSLTREQ